MLRRRYCPQSFSSLRDTRSRSSATRHLVISSFLASPRQREFWIALRQGGPRLKRSKSRAPRRWSRSDWLGVSRGVLAKTASKTRSTFGLSERVQKFQKSKSQRAQNNRRRTDCLRGDRSSNCQRTAASAFRRGSERSLPEGAAVFSDDFWPGARG